MNGKEKGSSVKTVPVKVGPWTIGGEKFTIIAGPCSIESYEHFLETAQAVKQRGAAMLRGGLFKLRTHPDSFQGLEAEGLDLAKRVLQEVQLPFFSEVTDPRQIGDLMDVVDVFQVGSRNMYNYSLLKELGQVSKPVLLKRSFSGTIKEWLLAAEYIAKAGNSQIILCERGIRTFETATRNTFDINAIAFIKQNSPFPILADPSHGTGKRSLVTPVALAATAAGADGLLLEVHPQPDQALSDGYQTLNFDEFENLVEKTKKLLPLLGRQLQEPL
ncbi:MAG: 3-deoxy-7-phosphoheptulonate synthase [Bdellovibrio sp.]|nr:MAG: 3-deoxy-7-phosphoheptulonate synthase [Bdellovibrio sp.]